MTSRRRHRPPTYACIYMGKSAPAGWHGGCVGAPRGHDSFAWTLTTTTPFIINALSYVHSSQTTLHPFSSSSLVILPFTRHPFGSVVRNIIDVWQADSRVKFTAAWARNPSRTLCVERVSAHSPSGQVLWPFHSSPTAPSLGNHRSPAMSAKEGTVSRADSTQWRTLITQSTPAWRLIDPPLRLTRPAQSHLTWSASRSYSNPPPLSLRASPLKKPPNDPSGNSSHPRASSFRPRSL